MRLSALYLNHCVNIAISQVFLSLCERWQGPDLTARMFVPSCAPECRRENLVEVIPRSLQWLCYRRSNLPSKLTEQRFFHDLHRFDAAYLFPPVSLETMQRVKACDKLLFLERVNCYTGKAKAILDAAYDRLGLPPSHPNTGQKVLQETEEMALADFLLCPSETVTQSFLEAGVAAEKLITTSEGWSPDRFPVPCLRTGSDMVTVLFLGSISVRKGAHLLLRAWEKAKLKGRLILMGQLEPAIAQTCAAILDRPDVTHIDNSPDYTWVYSQADIFALPSLEEGSPLVTYEAMGQALPILASPMGAGGIVRDGVDGLIIPPYAEAEWIDALHRLAANPDLRQALGASAWARAQDYTWDKVAARRAAMMLEKLHPAQSLVNSGV